MSLPRISHQPITRRLLVSGAAAVAAGPLLLNPEEGYAETSATLPAGLFRLGVASGDPLPEAVVIWTRLAPDPTGGGGMPQRVVPVEWEIAEVSESPSAFVGGTLDGPVFDVDDHEDSHPLRS